MTPIPHTPLPVVILGAGHGRRMGGPKIFTSHGGQTFLSRVLARCAESRSPVLLTVDPLFRERTEALIAEMNIGAALPVLRLVACDGNAPMLASVQTALTELVELAELEVLAAGSGFWLWPVDAPFISPEGWASAVKTVGEAPASILKLRVGGKTGHPIWFPGWSVAPVRDGNWPEGLLGFLADQSARIRILPLSGEVLEDFDTPEKLVAYGPNP